MMQVSIHEAETNLSKLVHMLEDGEEDIIYIERDGVRVAQITLVSKASDDFDNGVEP